MKKILFIILCLLFINYSHAHMTTYDAAASSQLTKLNLSAASTNKTTASTLAKTIATLKELSAMRAQYDKEIKMVEEVSSYVRSGKQVSNIKKSISEITSEYQKGVSYVAKEPTIKSSEKAKFINAYNAMMNETLDDFSYSTKIIGDGTLKMNDAERLTILGNIETKMQKKKELLVYFNSKVKRAVAIKLSNEKQNEFLTGGIKSINSNKKGN